MEQPNPTLSVLTGTVRTVVNAGGTHFFYSGCLRLTNPPRGRDATVHEAHLTPLGPDGAAYQPIALFRGIGLQAGRDFSECWPFNEFNATHERPARYRLRVTYYYHSDISTRLSLEGMSTLTPSP